MGNTNEFRGFVPPPKSAGQWIKEFTTDMQIPIPKLRKGLGYAEAKDIAVPENGTKGNPDLVVTLKNGAVFYIKFFNQQHPVFFPLDLPVLHWPVEAGSVGAFWIVADEHQVKSLK